MDQNSFQDIIPPKKTIRDIPIPEGRVSKIPDTLHFKNNVPVNPVKAKPALGYIKKNQPRRKTLGGYLWIAILVVVTGIIFGATVLFAKVTVNVAISNETVNVNIQATSTKDGASSTIPYSLVTFQKTGTIDLEANGEAKEVSNKASGTIVITNTTASAQQLIATTRFESPDTLIYRIDKSVTVPANGSVEALVYADVAGPNYNKGKTDFTIPGLKDTPKYKAINAKSKTDMSGGFTGTTKEVSPEELAAKKLVLEKKLIDEIAQDATKEIPDTAAFFKQGLVLDTTWTVTFENNQSMLKADTKAIAPVFKKEDILSLIRTESGQTLKSFNADDNLVVTIEGKDDLILLKLPTLYLSLSGSLSSFENVTISELQAKLAGKPKSDLQTILSSYPAINRIDATFVPPWQSSFPKNPEKINIVLTNAS